MATILAISSHVARGTVGLAASVPALQWLGHEVWPLPTVLLASRPGLGRLVRHDVPVDRLRAMLTALEADGCWRALNAVLVGYFPSAASASAAASAVRRIRQAAPHIPVLIDPIVGDAGRLYVAETTAAAIRDELLPLATVATPNLFELGWLTGAPVQGSAHDSAGLAAVADAARRLGVSAVVVTSAAETEAAVTTLAVTDEAAIERTSPRRRAIPNGAGDLLAGLLLGNLLRDRNMAAALDASLTALDRVLAASGARPALDLSALTRAG
jgi:pyridoxine kinase